MHHGWASYSKRKVPLIIQADEVVKHWTDIRDCLTSKRAEVDEATGELRVPEGERKPFESEYWPRQLPSILSIAIMSRFGTRCHVSGALGSPKLVD